MSEDFASGYGPLRGNPDAPGNYVVAANNGLRLWRLQPAVDDEYWAKTPDVPPSDDRLYLSSVSQRYNWTAGVNRAQCMLTYSQKRSREIVGIPPCRFPTKGCMCGFYAYYDVQHWIHPGQWHCQRWPTVAGVIAAWGHCVIGTKGFRAESALINGLVVPSADTLADRWVNGRDREECRDIIRDLLRKRFPAVPVYESANELLRNTPLEGPPR